MLEDIRQLPPRGEDCGKRSSTPQSTAERMRLYRRRRQRQLLPVRVELTPVDIDALVKRGYLELKDRDDTSAIEQAANEFISDALCDD
jgi:hypothetical protein